MWVYNPHTGGSSIPPDVKTRNRAADSQIRRQALLGQVDLPRGSAPPPRERRDQWIERLRNTPMYLCRIRYFGNEDRWSFAWYTYAHEKYEPGFLITGDDHGTPEEAFETSAQFL